MEFFVINSVLQRLPLPVKLLIFFQFFFLFIKFAKSIIQVLNNLNNLLPLITCNRQLLNTKAKLAENRTHEHLPVSCMIFKLSRRRSSYTLVPPISFRRSNRSESFINVNDAIWERKHVRKMHNIIRRHKKKSSTYLSLLHNIIRIWTRESCTFQQIHDFCLPENSKTTRNYQLSWTD